MYARQIEQQYPYHSIPFVYQKHRGGGQNLQYQEGEKERKLIKRKGLPKLSSSRQVFCELNSASGGINKVQMIDAIQRIFSLYFFFPLGYR